MDLVYIWFDNTYTSKVLFSNTLNYSYDLKGKVMDLELSFQCFVLKFFTAHIFQAI